MKRKEPSQRQLRVGEMLRQALGELFMRGDLHIEPFDSRLITISEVETSPDMRHANVYVMPLGGIGAQEVVKVLQEHAPEILRSVARKVHLKYLPKLHFHLDESFVEGDKISRRLRQIHVVEDDGGDEEE